VMDKGAVVRANRTPMFRQIVLQTAILGVLASSLLPAQSRPTPTDAQRRALLDSAQNRLGRPVSQQEIADAIRRSGLSDADLRRRLREMGYDPALVDQFSRQGGSALTSNSQVSQGFAQALQSIGVLTVAPQSLLTEADERRIVEVAAPVAEAATTIGPQVFGKDVFRRGTAQFDPASVGPIDPTYRVAAGDQVQLVLTGDVEVAYELSIRRDGSILVPQLGGIFLAGLTLEAAAAVVRQRAAAAYSGVSSGRTKVDLAVSRVRANVVTVIGDVEEPGAYQVNALASMYHAVARAGGPTARGSFRSIEVRRGGQLLAKLDLYRYLLKGDASEDLRTEQGDIIFVPLAQRKVTVDGAVRRPGIYELKEGEGFDDLLAFTGGLRADAATERIQVDRILPSQERSPGRDRVLIDMRLDEKESALRKMSLADGDVVRVFAVSGMRRGVVSLRGAVFRPGTYQLDSASTLGQLLSLAKGTMPWAMSDRIKVSRQIPQTGQSESFSVDMGTESGRTFTLQEFDAVEVLDARIAYPASSISVSGAVYKPGSFSFARKQVLRDVIDLAGGLREEASEIIVARRRNGIDYSDTTSIVYSFNVFSEWQEGNGRAGQFPLQQDDRVFIRVSPGFRPQRFVDVSGMFKLGGSFAINESLDRISTVVASAGGLLPGAYGGSFRLMRAGRPVAVDLDRAMSGDLKHDIPLIAGDRLYVGANPSTVLVTGEVERPSLVRFDQRISFTDFVDQAGGVKPNGNLKAAYVEYPNGLIKRVRTRFRVFNSYPVVVSGSIVTIPEKPQRPGGSTERALQITAQITSLLASAALTIVALRR
jgi:protein involved in polysaccharide export with SLBB domain